MIRSKHSLSHYRLLSCNQGQLVPIGLVEVLPGDTLQHATSVLVRVAPLNTPVMHPVHVRVHHIYCPTRVAWPNFEKFITGGEDGYDASVFPYVTIPGGGFAVGSLADYLGIPPSVGAGAHVSAIPFRIYNLIWREFYRDQDLQTKPNIGTGDGADVTTDLNLLAPCWEKDYLTVARPWTQKGPDVSLPLGSYAPVKGLGRPTQNNVRTGPVTAVETPVVTSYAKYSKIDPANADEAFYVEMDNGPMGAGYPNVRADLSAATAAKIGDLRHAIGLMKFEEARARFGGRYVEYLRFLGIRPSDQRLQRPEYLAGGKQTIQFSEVLQTGVDTSGTPLTGVGRMAGHGIGAVRSNRYRRFFEEHGYVFTLLSIMPKTIYADGLPRHWSRSTKEDFFQRELQFIGQQVVKNKEARLAHATPEGTFGYSDRYDEYRRIESSIHGDMRTTFNTWHMARQFSGDPALNATFVSANPTNRVYQNTAGTQLMVMAQHSIQARRMVAKDGTPHGL